MFEETKIMLNEATRRRLILLLEEDLMHGEATLLMGDILGALMTCNSIILEN